MTTAYKIRIYDGTTLKGEITDMLSLVISRKVNDFALCKFEIESGNEYASQIVKNIRLEVWRKTNSIDWYREENLIVRGIENAWNGMTNSIIVTAVGGNWLLSTRVIAWKSGTVNRSTFDSQKAETIAKNLVKYNLGSSATVANGRIVDGTNNDVVTQTDSATGNSIDLSCAYDNLLKTLQDIAGQGGGDFDMYWTGSAWQFCWYDGQLGSDLTGSLLFSLERGNLESPKLIRDWTTEKTVAIIGGQGEGTDRNVRTRTGADYSSTNKIEIFVDARDVTAGSTNENDTLDKRGDFELTNARAKNILDFVIIQSTYALYGDHYMLGDLGKVEYAGVSMTVQISDVYITFQPGMDETINIGVKNV